MNKGLLLIFLFIAFLLGCKNDSNIKIKEKPTLIIQAGYDDNEFEDFKYYSDSTYTFYIKRAGFNYEKIEKFNGFVILKMTLYILLLLNLNLLKVKKQFLKIIS